ncbi:hypothetical protein MVEN_01271400 [Mycena venus]|uniref:C2H2-type domain-containing protein n=1 Tax=Mycena venus TaxID=2733690 RepID=A0A8H7CYP5_9AGAR|nr:hypothetical protein MVEN_01271400 [Mycena venus]
MPDVDFQTNRLAVVSPPPKPIGLGLDCVDARLARPYGQLRLPTIQRRTNPARVLRTGSSFDCEKSLASMKIEADSIPPFHLATSPITSAPFSAEKPEFNSLYDLDVQYPSSRSLNNPSPQSALNYSYSPALSPSWTLDSILSASAFLSPDTLTSSSPDTRLWSSSLKTSISSLASSSPSIAHSTLEESRLDCTPNIAVPLADINMFRIPTSVRDFNSSVDPAYIALDHPLPPSIDPPRPAETFSNPRNSFITIPTVSPALYCTATMPTMTTSTFRPRFPVSRPTFQANPPSRVPKRKTLTQDAPSKKKRKVMEPEPEVVFGTPILDAHRGITQTELEAKAARFQQRNPGVEDFDKRWLASFSGKLTAMGEIMEDFRCYVVGCTQMNRRRDHMVVHVGSHLDQRRFKCEQCPKRYRRNNELKRHERSHDGSRPFVCLLCPTQKSTFKRQDLLNRHLNNKHRAEKENDAPRKERKLEQCTDL